MAGAHAEQGGTHARVAWTLHCAGSPTQQWHISVRKDSTCAVRGRRAYTALTWLGVDPAVPRRGLGAIEEFH